ncbi:Hypothetical protein CAP_2586 [Chondromyces apiculatus DSM 436]|uniref:Uncharacterized protein n=1 Tax=Chondromyces apiculatus DSM 436 TaxID=1192034 RepID=A0A017TIP9_9BACT|nr:Hypothetical protein CAP_2586 [Chondromyces apiculatus DSM 436]
MALVMGAAFAVWSLLGRRGSGTVFRCAYASVAAWSVRAA